MVLVQKRAPIPIYHPTYGKRYARYPNGALILTEFDDKILKEIAEITQAKYFNATNTDELKKVYQDINALEKTVIQTTKITLYLICFHTLYVNCMSYFVKRSHCFNIVNRSSNVIMFQWYYAAWGFLILPVLAMVYYFRFKDRGQLWQTFQAKKIGQRQFG